MGDVHVPRAGRLTGRKLVTAPGSPGVSRDLQPRDPHPDCGLIPDGGGSPRETFFFRDLRKKSDTIQIGETWYTSDR